MRKDTPVKYPRCKLTVGFILAVLLVSGFLTVAQLNPLDSMASSGTATLATSNSTATGAKLVQGTGGSCQTSNASCTAVAEFSKAVKAGDVIVVDFYTSGFFLKAPNPTVKDSLASSYSVANQGSISYCSAICINAYVYLYLATAKKIGSDTLSVTLHNGACDGNPKCSSIGIFYAFDVSDATTSSMGSDSGGSSCDAGNTCLVSTASSLPFKGGAFLLGAMIYLGAPQAGAGFTLYPGGEYATPPVSGFTNFPATTSCPSDAEYGYCAWVDLGLVLEPKSSPVAGYVATSGTQEITSATSEWKVASVTCNSALSKAQDMAAYLELSDLSTSESIGTGAICAKGASSPTYEAFAFFSPSDKSYMILPLAINAGDQVSVNITLSPSNDVVTANITDITTGKSTTYSETVSGTLPVTAYWFVYNGGAALAKFSHAVNFQDCNVAISGVTTSLAGLTNYKILMANKNAKTLAEPSSLSSSGAAFSVVWKGYQ